MASINKDFLLQALNNVMDPYTHRAIVDFIVNLSNNDGIISIILDYPEEIGKAKTNLDKELKALCEQVLRNIEGFKDLRLAITWQQTVTPAPTKSAKAKIKPDRVKNIILVASGKGGVGKSTVAANLAIALMDLGFKVGLMDADIYGPSIPRLFGVVNTKAKSADGKIIPIQKYGLELMSIGFLVNPETATIWRGPMVTKTLYQLIMMTRWPALDYLIIDTPPGTGDVHLTLGESYDISGLIGVSTPQDIAVDDMAKCIDMCQKLDMRILGIIENMAYFMDQLGKKHYIFGQSNIQKLKGTKLLASIPLVEELANASDRGKPIPYYDYNSEITTIFHNLALLVSESVK